MGKSRGRKLGVSAISVNEKKYIYILIRDAYIA